MKIFPGKCEDGSRGKYASILRDSVLFNLKQYICTYLGTVPSLASNKSYLVYYVNTVNDDIIHVVSCCFIQDEELREREKPGRFQLDERVVFGRHSLGRAAPGFVVLHDKRQI